MCHNKIDCASFSKSSYVHKLQPTRGNFTDVYCPSFCAALSVCLIMVTVINSTGWMTETCCFMSMKDYLCMQTLSLLTLIKCRNVLLFHSRDIDLNPRSEHKNPNISNRKNEEAGCLRSKAVWLRRKVGTDCNHRERRGSGKGKICEGKLNKQIHSRHPQCLFKPKTKAHAFLITPPKISPKP